MRTPASGGGGFLIALRLTWRTPPVFGRSMGHSPEIGTRPNHFVGESLGGVPQLPQAPPAGRLTQRPSPKGKAPNASTFEAAFGVSARRALGNSACARRSNGPRQERPAHLSQ